MQFCENYRRLSDYYGMSQATGRVLAFAGAGKEFRLFSSDKHELVKQIEEHVFEDFSFTFAGVRITCDVEYDRYEMGYSGETLWPVDNQDNHFNLKFTMVRE